MPTPRQLLTDPALWSLLQFLETGNSLPFGKILLVLAAFPGSGGMFSQIARAGSLVAAEKRLEVAEESKFTADRERAARRG
jgi:hypothetical protein